MESTFRREFDRGEDFSQLPDTVIRGGYSRQYGRLNGVDLVLVPLLGTGLIQPVQYQAALLSAVVAQTTLQIRPRHFALGSTD